MDNSQKVLQKTKQLKDKVEAFNNLVSKWEDTLVLIDLANEENDESMLPDVVSATEEIEADIDKMTLETLLSGHYDKNNAIMTFHAGAGGTEAQDWCEMLIRMYQMWAQKNGYTATVLDSLPGDEAGIKSCTIEIDGLNAYGYLKAEKGVHRLMRISPFNSAGKRMTSFASIEVMPELDDNVEVDIRPEDIKMEAFRASGAGGQHINKTSSAVRLTHIPTGVQKEKISDIKGEQMDNGWGSQIRSYVFQPYTMVKDLRTGFEMGNIGAVMDGDLNGFINAYLKAASLGTLKK